MSTLMLNEEDAREPVVIMDVDDGVGTAEVLGLPASALAPPPTVCG